MWTQKPPPTGVPNMRRYMLDTWALLRVGQRQIPDLLIPSAGKGPRDNQPQRADGPGVYTPVSSCPGGLDGA